MKSRIGIALLLVLALAVLGLVLWLRHEKPGPNLPERPPETAPELTQRVAVPLDAPEVRVSEPVASSAPSALPASGSREVRCVVLDEALGTPVAGITVHLEGRGGQRSKHATAADGSFLFPSALMSGGMWIALTDGAAKRAVEAEPRRLEEPLASGAELVIRARIGPTFRWRLLRSQESQSGTGNPAPCLVRLRNLEPDLDGPAPRGNPFSNWEELGTADEASVRYPIPARTIEPGLALAEFRTPNFFFGARVTIDSWSGEQPWRTVALQPSGVAQGRVEDEKGVPLEDASATVRYLDPLPGDVPERALTNVQGTFFLQAFEPARVKELAIEKEGYEPYAWRIVLRPGSIPGQRIVLKKR